MLLSRGEVNAERVTGGPPTVTRWWEARRGVETAGFGLCGEGLDVAGEPGTSEEHRPWQARVQLASVPSKTG